MVENKESINQPDSRNKRESSPTDATGSELSGIDNYILNNSDLDMEKIFNPDEDNTDSDGSETVGRDKSMENNNEETNLVRERLSASPSDRIPGNKGTGTDLSGQVLQTPETLPS